MLRKSRGVFDLPTIDDRIADLERESAQPNFWDDSRTAKAKMRDLSQLASKSKEWRGLVARTKDLVQLAELADQGEADAEFTQQLSDELRQLTDRFDKMRFELELVGEYDSRPAILAVKSGAGGVDAQDWAEMLIRMYSRWAEAKGFGLDLMDETPGDEAGIKAATLRVDGRNAYGLLRTERGVHRLIRISPFDSAHRRHTSFALVEVLPEPEEEPEAELNPDDLRFDFFRASGHGGQNVQKNSTAVRVTHIPSGIVVSVQNERSQAQNRTLSLRILQARLADLELRRKEKERQILKGKHVSAEFGRQARSYFIHPYQMVKDHRTGLQMTDAQKVLDGDIDGFLRESLSAGVTIAASDGG